MSEGYLISARVRRELEELVRAEASRYVNPEGHRARWHNQIRNPTCNIVWIVKIWGAPSGGTFEMRVIDPTTSTDIAVFDVDYNADAAALKAQLDTETGMVWTVSAGPFPLTEIQIRPPIDRRDLTISVPSVFGLVEDGFTIAIDVYSCCR